MMDTLEDAMLQCSDLQASQPGEKRAGWFAEGQRYFFDVFWLLVLIQIDTFLVLDACNSKW